MRCYVAVIDGEPGGYGAWFPDLPGCTTMGATFEELAVNANAVIRDWTAAWIESGGSLPGPSSIEELRDDPDVVEALREGAELRMLVTASLGCAAK